MFALHSGLNAYVRLPSGLRKAVLNKRMSSGDLKKAFPYGIEFRVSVVVIIILVVVVVVVVEEVVVEMMW